MAEQDYYIKKLLMDKKRFADLYNVQVFHGKQVLRPEDLEYVPNESGIVVLDGEGRRKVVQRRRDVIMKASFGAYFILAACEGQENVHYAMPVRNMMYDALDYTEQVQTLEKKHKQDGDRLSGAEFLSGITADDRIIPVISLVFYHGKENWNGPRSLYDMMGFDENLFGIDEIKMCLPDYRLNLVYAGEIEHPEQFQTSLQHIFTMLKYNSNKKTLYEYVKTNKEELRQMDDDSVLAVLALLGGQKRLMKLMEESKEQKEGLDMCKAIDDLIEDGKAEGKIEGKVESVLEILTELGDIPTELQARILDERDGRQLINWLKIAARAESIREFEEQIGA